MKLVTFDYDISTDLGSINKIIKSQGTWAHLTHTTWLVGGDLKYDQLRDLLYPFNPQHLVIIPFDYSHWATYDVSEDIKTFLNNNLANDD